MTAQNNEKESAFYSDMGENETGNPVYDNFQR